MALAKQQFILQQQCLDQYTQTIYMRLHNLIQIQELELRNLENHIESRNPFYIEKQRLYDGNSKREMGQKAERFIK